MHTSVGLRAPLAARATHRLGVGLEPPARAARKQVESLELREEQGYPKRVEPPEAPGGPELAAAEAGKIAEYTHWDPAAPVPEDSAQAARVERQAGSKAQLRIC